MESNMVENTNFSDPPQPQLNIIPAEPRRIPSYEERVPPEPPPPPPPLDLAALEARSREELLDLAKAMNVAGLTGAKKQEIIMRLLQANTVQQGNIFSSGILEIMPDGYGFLRQASLLPSNSDIYVSQSQIRRFGLRTGDMIIGQARAAKPGEKYYSLLRVEAINDLNPEAAKQRRHFGQLTPTFPDRLIDLET